MANQVAVGCDFDWLGRFDSQSSRGEITHARMPRMLPAAQAPELPESLPAVHRANQVKIEHPIANAGSGGNPHTAAGNFGVAGSSEEKFLFEHFLVESYADTCGM